MSQPSSSGGSGPTPANGGVPDESLTAKERDQLTMQASAVEALNRDFAEVLNELVGDKSLERFRLEYEKLYQTLKKSHENEKRLIKRCRDLNAEIVANAAKIQTALRLSLQDQNSITLLKKEIDKAWKMVDGAQEKEKRARETIQRLKGEIQNLSRLVDQGAGLSIGQENAVNDLLKVKADLTRQVEIHTGTIAQNQKQMQEMMERIKGLEEKRISAEKEISSLREKNIKLKSDTKRGARDANRLREEMKKIKEVNDKHKMELVDQKHKFEEVHARYTDLEIKSRVMNFSLQQYQTVANELKQKNEELEHAIKEKIKNNSELEVEKEEAVTQITKHKRDIRLKIQERDKAEKKFQNAIRQKEFAENKRKEAETYKNWLKEQMKNVLKSVENQRREAENDEKLIKELHQQVKRLTQSLQISADKNAMQLKLVEDHEVIKDGLEEDIINHKKEEQKLRKRNYILEKQREAATMKSAQWKAKHQELLETIKLKDMEVNELTKNILEEKNKLKIQQNLYEQVRSDRNLFSKQQVQSEDEIAEMKRKFKIMTHQINQLKEEILTKDTALINEHFAFKDLQDEMKVVKRKLSKRKEVLATADAVLAAQDAEINNLRRTLAEAEGEQHHQKRSYDDVVQERDILGTQLIRRNDELALLYEKIRIQQSTLNKGEIQYRKRLEEIQRLRLSHADTKRQLQIRSHEVTNIEALKNEVYHVQRELLQERTKVKALSEELENPMNVHRWRKLEGSDPKRYELIQQIQTLQKRLITKTEQVVEKDLLLREKEKLYVQLKNLLARQPGPEVAEQLSVYQHSLKEKTRQMKAMASELNMFQAQVNEYRHEIERVTRELQDVKRKYFEQKRKEQLKAELENTTAAPLELQQMEFHRTQPKTLGGGFNLNNNRPQFQG